jgi:hypothetical protein
MNSPKPNSDTRRAEEQAMLEEFLHKRRIDGWRRETAAAARKAIKAFRAGTLKGQSFATVINQLRDVK